MDINPIRWGWLAGLALMAAGCGEAEPLDVDHVLSVTDFPFTLSGRPAVTVHLGGDQDNHLSITLRREDIRAGFEACLHCDVTGPVAVDADWRGTHFVHGAPLGTSYFVAIEAIDPATKKATLRVAVDLSAADQSRHIMMDARRFEVSGTDFDHLTQPPKR
ncbi:hypothetical protein SAMN02949497_1718 [Methylomagnum ishizawai]|uniref:Lipoprotein n=1 Tax=Methylomagnum ishizawai TaxID=1760988 RepID=A0A1Y6D0P5_9GAMM|nr:hypothetical protein [Methylomagnum ishizawai]SMF94403.1 hypothetical protein SAMN02949497_1718 [Methylomagnum ishizawai]